MEADLDPLSQVTQVAVPADFIDLGLGDPQLALLPQEMIHQAARDRLSMDDPMYLQYGANQGDGPFRHSLAKFLEKGYGFPVDPGELFITSGASMGLHLVCSFFTQPGDTVFIEEPTYMFALRIFADHGLQLIPLEIDADGLVIESLEKNLAQCHPKFLYLIPTYQNPSGRTLTQERREQAVALSQEHGFLIVADEVYHLLSYREIPPKPFAAYAAAGNIISLGSFSKILAPGLRLGWFHAGQTIIERFVNSGLLESGGGMNPFTSAILRSVLDTGGLEQNIARLIGIYRNRLATMDNALRKDIPELEYTPPGGGYFIWTRLPDGLTARELQTKAKSFRVGFRPGTLFSSRGSMQEYIRLCFVFYDVGDLAEGIFRLKEALHS